MYLVSVTLIYIFFYQPFLRSPMSFFCWHHNKSKVDKLSRGWPEGSFFNSYHHRGIGEGATPFPGKLLYSLHNGPALLHQYMFFLSTLFAISSSFFCQHHNTLLKLSKSEIKIRTFFLWLFVFFCFFLFMLVGKIKTKKNPKFC